MILTLVHDSPGQARENVAQLPRRIDAGFSFRSDRGWAEVIDDVDAWVDGLLLISKLRGSLTDDWISVALDDTLLLHSGP